MHGSNDFALQERFFFFRSGGVFLKKLKKKPGYSGLLLQICLRFL